jgi:hypothetical protein
MKTKNVILALCSMLLIFVFTDLLISKKPLCFKLINRLPNNNPMLSESEGVFSETGKAESNQTQNSSASTGPARYAPEQLLPNILVPYAELEKDMKKRARMSASMKGLAHMQTRESIAALMKLLQAEPVEKYFIMGREPNGTDWLSYSHQSMLYLRDVLEGVPEPLNGAIYETPDVYKFRQWWEENKDQLRFKQLPTRYEIVLHDMNDLEEMSQKK